MSDEKHDPDPESALDAEVSTSDLPDVDAEESEGAKRRSEVAKSDTDEEPEEELEEEPEGESEEEPEGESEDGDGEEPPAKPKGKVSPGVQKRFDELTRARRDAERQRDQAFDMLQRLQRGEQPTQEQQRAQRQPEPEVKPPRRMDYDSDSEFDQANATYVQQEAARQARKAVEDYQRQSQQSQAQQQQQEAFQTFQAAEEQFAAEHEDYFDVTRDSSLPITDAMYQSFLDMENGPEIAYHLANNRAEAARIAGLPDIAQVREIGKLDAKLSTPSRRKTTKAPEPPKKLAGGGKTKSRPGDNWTQADWDKWHGYRK